MKIEIEQYKGQTIEYDENTDKFICDISIQDKSKSAKRGSLKDLRKEIDQYIKQNLEFKPFKLFEKKSYSDSFNIITVEGIRTDGKFVTRSSNYPNSINLMDFEREIKSGDEFFNFDNEIVKLKNEINKQEKEYDEIIKTKNKNLLKELKRFDILEVKRYTDAFAKS